MSNISDNTSELQEILEILQNKAFGGDETEIKKLTKRVYELENNKVDKINTSWILYGNGANETPMQYFVSEQPNYAGVVVRRDSKMDILLPETPSSNNSATSKKYVDDRDNELSERISDLESLTLTFTEDKTVAYEKSVPANVGKYALIKSVGGATKKVGLSKNILNPRDIAIQDYAEDIVYNEDGSITLTIPYNTIVVATLPKFPEKTYGMYAYSDHFDFLVSFNTENGTEYGSIGWNTFNSATHNDVYLELGNMDWNNEGEEAYPPVRVTFKIAVFEDTTEQPYEPFREEFDFINAEVKKIESIGANLIPFPYVYGVTTKDVGYKETNNGVTYEVLENGLISAIGTATAVSTFQIFKKIMPQGNYYLSGKSTSGGSVIGSYNYNTPNYDAPQNGVGTINQKFTHAGGMFGAYIKINNGVTVNSIFSPIITKDVYVADFKPYRVEPIDSITFPVDEIKARVNDYDKGIDTTDNNYIECVENKKFYWQKCKEIVLKGTEPYITAYGYGGMNGISIQYLLDANYNRQKAICTDTDKTKESDITINSMWIGANGNKTVYWVGVLDYLGLSTIDEFKTYLANRYASGNPVRILYKLATPKVTDITDLFAEDNAIQVEDGGSLRFVNENEMPIPNTIQYVTKKGG